eukprot:Trichotokara_eunicae@DN4333_c1_g1_i1.p1
MSAGWKPCYSCGDKNVLAPLAEIGEYVCFECSKKMPERYSKVSQTIGCKQYGLLPTRLVQLEKDGVLAVLRKPNPKKYDQPMKLFYEFQLKALAIQTYGSLEKMEEILEMKREKRFAEVLNEKTNSIVDKKMSENGKVRTKIKKKIKKKKNEIFIPPHIHEWSA